DRMSMATSLEARVPLLDHKMVEFAFSLPENLKLKGNTTKYFMKNALRGLLPDEIIDRQKEGFSIPIKNWLKTNLKDLMMEYLSEKRIKDSGLFNYNVIQTMIDEHLNNRQNHAHRLWSLILFNIWREKFLI
ncbi:MAG: asparagine synthase (glutamine-hydrolyzing), partial [Candidatus Aminicenantes bacterium]|nr:asparagine synthase (glutamine-hydrolyzing) [Candidatus Aminicenantes bacterium]